MATYLHVDMLHFKGTINGQIDKLIFNLDKRPEKFRRMCHDNRTCFTSVELHTFANKVRYHMLDKRMGCKWVQLA